MGLVSLALQSIYLGVHCVLLPPLYFLQKPVRWLRAISRYRATTSGAPNFAYDACVGRCVPTNSSLEQLARGLQRRRASAGGDSRSVR